MPRIMSYSLTTTPMYLGIKFVTRRTGWDFLKPKDVVTAVEKGMGLKKGQTVKRIGDIQIVSNSETNLGAMIIDKDYGRRETILEGFPSYTAVEFVDMFMEHNPKITRHTLINRIQFQLLYSVPQWWECSKCGYQYPHRKFVTVLFDMECHRCLKTMFSDFEPRSDKEHYYPFVANRWKNALES